MNADIAQLRDFLAGELLEREQSARGAEARAEELTGFRLGEDYRRSAVVYRASAEQFKQYLATLDRLIAHADGSGTMPGRCFKCGDPASHLIQSHRNVYVCEAHALEGADLARTPLDRVPA